MGNIKICHCSECNESMQELKKALAEVLTAKCNKGKHPYCPTATLKVPCPFEGWCGDVTSDDWLEVMNVIA